MSGICTQFGISVGERGGGGHTYTSNTLHRKSALCSFMLIHVYCIKHLAILQLAFVVILPFLLFPFALPSCYNDGNVCMFSQDDAAQPNVLHHGQTHRAMTEPGFLSYPLLSLSRLCEMNCEDSRCRGVSQCELLLHLITARNGTAEPSFFFTFRLASWDRCWPCKMSDTPFKTTESDWFGSSYYL